MAQTRLSTPFIRANSGCPAIYISLLERLYDIRNHTKLVPHMQLHKTCSDLQQALTPGASASVRRHWSKGLPWSLYLEMWALAMADNIRVGAVFLLAALTTPLSTAMFCYHLYLIWAGMTTNESDKWSDWRDDIADGVAFKAKSSQIYGDPYDSDDMAGYMVPWPKLNDQTLVFTDGQAPKEGFLLTEDCFSIIQPDNPEAKDDPRWTRVLSMKEVKSMGAAKMEAKVKDESRSDQGTLAEYVLM
ncbi:palmitoyltransferase swf1 [Emydomyces testavorans]|uniref:Palmitoyltransferase swf1 n=1 Tax=Emydomyces testavorans TaxID=2070801 RepID=A0AAF0DIP0_9EURO|nr:palmitoyltransferase swf1 [Emydomyces testavorans]